MTKLEGQLQYLRQELGCSVTVDDRSPHVRVCNLAIPWCSRHLLWQLLLPTASSGGPDLVFDDDSFHPLCTGHSTTGPASGGAPGAASLRALLRAWPTTSATSTTTTTTATAAEAHRPPEALARLVSLLLELYRGHQLRRLEAAAVALPRLQFELSTLEVGAGVQMELQQQQASFALPLPAVDLTRLMEVAEMYGVKLPPCKPHASSAAPAGPAGGRGSPGAVQVSTGHTGASAAPAAPAASAAAAAAAAAAAGSPGRGVGSDNDDILEPLEDGPPSASGAAEPSRGAPESAAAAGQPPVRAQQLVLVASFRLPTGAGGDLSDPDLSLQLPPLLAQLGATSTSPASATSSSSTAATAPGTAPAPSTPSSGAAPSMSSTSGGPTSSSSSLPSLPFPLVPSFQLPLWSQHMCLAEYVPLASERLAAQLEAHCTQLTSRQQVLEHLAEMLGPPLELNAAGGSALFSLAWEGSPVVAAVELGARFPASQPTIVLHCVRQLSSSDAVRTYRDYPWSPRWSPREMAARIHNWLKEELPNFMRGRPT